MNNLRMLRVPDVVKKTGISKSTIYAMIKDGKFPEQTRDPELRMSFWFEHEIDKWIMNRYPAVK